MAKETAHQLGTPLTSLMGWLEVIGADHRNDLGLEDQQKLVDSTLDNMTADVDRLQRVANRFGQIGSRPEMKDCDLNVLAAETVEYYRKRLPFEGAGVQMAIHRGDIPAVQVNPELFTWVLENLVKNSLQAVDARDGRVTISTGVSDDGKTAFIEIHDNGKGVPSSAARKLFRPGFTTKKRGWGMGLTLVKRIVEEYHRGRVWLVKSSPGDTLFRITLPVSGGKV
jgi:signal transduction histidine kinase